MIRKLSSSGMADLQAYGPRWGVPVLCPSALAQCSRSIRVQKGAQLQESCILMGGHGGRGAGMGLGFVPFTQASRVLWGANEPCLGASQLLLQKGTEVLHHLLALFNCPRYLPKSKTILGTAFLQQYPNQSVGTFWSLKVSLKVSSHVLVYTQSHEK